MTRGEYNKLRGWQVPVDENPDDEGFLVEYPDSPNANHADYDNYISWSPVDVFERSYRIVNGHHHFGQALEILKAGGRVMRQSDTNFSFIVKMSRMKLPPYNDQSTERKVNDRTAKWIGKDTPLITTDYLAAMTVDGKWMPGWTPTQDDLFARDWIVVKDES